MNSDIVQTEIVSITDFQFSALFAQAIESKSRGRTKGIQSRK